MATSGPGAGRSRCGQPAPAGLHGTRGEHRGGAFARHRSGFTSDFEDLVAFLATRPTRAVRHGWSASTGTRWDASAPGWSPTGWNRPAGRAGAYRRGRGELQTSPPLPDAGHRQDGKKIVWGAEGKDAATLDAFYTELGEQRANQLEAVSKDMGAAFNESTREHAPKAVRCIDPSTPSRSTPTPWIRSGAPPGSRSAARPGRRPQVQGRPLVPARTTQEPHRRAISDAAPAPPPRRGPLAPLHPHRGLPRDLRR